MQPAPNSESCLIAALGYPIWIVALVALFTDVQHNRFVRFHAVQALLYTIAWLVVFMVLRILLSWRVLILQPLLVLGWLGLSLYYAYRAYQGEVFSIPVVSQFTSRFGGSES